WPRCCGSFVLCGERDARLAGGAIAAGLHGGGPALATRGGQPRPEGGGGPNAALLQAGIFFHHPPTSPPTTPRSGRQQSPQAWGGPIVIRTASRIGAGPIGVAAALIVLAAGTPVRAAEQWNFYMHQSAPNFATSRGAKMFTEEIEKATNGELKV